MKIKPFNELQFASGVDFRTMGIIRNAAYNMFKIELCQRLGNYQDTNYRYDLYLSSGKTITKQTENNLRYVINGIIFACQSER